jgi:hypothetical protein
VDTRHQSPDTWHLVNAICHSHSSTTYHSSSKDTGHAATGHNRLQDMPLPASPISASYTSACGCMAAGRWNWPKTAGFPAPSARSTLVLHAADEC